jgi:hypothetical protein
VSGVETFVVCAADAGEEGGILTVGIAERPSADGRVLLFMSPLPDDDPPLICLTNEAAAVVYGGIDSIHLARSALRLRFQPGVGVGLGLPDDAVMRLELPPSDFEVLTTGLREVVARCQEVPLLVIEPE